MGLAIVSLLLFVTATGASAAETKIIPITAQKYDFAPQTINVQLGDRVVLEVTATDTEHGFGLGAFDIDRDLPEGKTVRIAFIADKQSEFDITCTRFCGWGHFGMSGKLIVS